MFENAAFEMFSTCDMECTIGNELTPLLSRELSRSRERYRCHGEIESGSIQTKLNQSKISNHTTKIGMGNVK